MGEATTFADLITQPVSEKVYLAELYPAQELSVWTLAGGMTYTYQKSFLNEQITLADSSTENIRKVLSGVTEDGAALTERASIALVEANPGSWWHYTGTNLLTNGDFSDITETELHDDANAAADPAEAEADAVTGFSSVFLTGTGANVFESQGAIKSAGDYALHANSDDTPSPNARFYKDIGSDWGLSLNDICAIRFTIRNTGTGLNTGRWHFGLSAANNVMTTPIGTIDKTETDFVDIEYYLQYDVSLHRFLVVRENNAENDGGVYFDNLSFIRHTLAGWTGWTPYLSAGVIYEKAYKAPSNAADLERAGLAAVPGWIYTIKWTLAKIAGDAGDGITVEFGSEDGTLRTASGTYTETITATDDDYLKFKQTDADADLEVTIDDISVVAAGRVLIHPTGSDDPADHTIVGFFPLRLATKAITLDGNFYEPLIAEKGIPALHYKSKDIYWGSEVITSGDLQLINSSGFFDQIFRSFIWSGKAAVIKLGGDALAYAEYNTIFTGTIQGKKYTRRQISFSLKTKAFNLFQAIPLNKYTTTDYAHLDPAAEGKPIPYFYGVYSATQAPEATCIDTAYTVNETQWKICDTAPGSIKSITQVYVNFDAGGGWEAIAHSNEDLAAATFTLETAFVAGATRVKVAFEGYYSGSDVIEGAPEIVEHLLTSILPYASGDLNAASFAASVIESDVTLNVPIESETTAMAVIDKICASDIAFFDEDADGKFRYRTWSCVRGAGLDDIVDSDFIGEPEITDDLEHLYWKTFIGYGYLCADKKYLYHEETSDESDYKYERRETYKNDTYLRGAADALLLSQRLLFLMGSPGPTLRGRTKLQLAGKILGDQIYITLARAPFSAGGYVQRVFEIFGLDKSCFPAFIDFEARDVQDFGSNAGMWAAADAPDWDAATEDEKNISGFWLDANGFADPADPDTKNISRWW